VDADMIVVMNDGRVQAIGKHDELMKRDPLYYRLANSQLQAATSTASWPMDPSGASGAAGAAGPAPLMNGAPVGGPR
jgi:hypothetical protein